MTLETETAELIPPQSATGDNNATTSDLARMIRDRRTAGSPSASANQPNEPKSEPEVKMGGAPKPPKTQEPDALEIEDIDHKTDGEDPDEESEQPSQEPEEPQAGDSDDLKELLKDFPKDQAKAMHKLYERINEVTGKYRQEQQARQELEERLRQTQSNGQEPGDRNGEDDLKPEGANVQSGVDDPVLKQIDDQITGLDRVMQWCRSHRDGGEIQANGQTIELDSDQVEQMRDEANMKLTALHSRRAVREDTVRERMETQRSQAIAEAYRVHPWLKDENHPLFAQAREFIAANPQVKNLPNAHMVVGDIISGRAARSKTPAKPPVKPAKRQVAPTPVVTGGAGSGPNPSGAEHDLVSAEEQFAKTGSLQDQKALIAARRRAREAQAA